MYICITIQSQRKAIMTTTQTNTIKNTSKDVLQVFENVLTYDVLNEIPNIQEYEFCVDNGGTMELILNEMGEEEICVNVKFFYSTDTTFENNTGRTTKLEFSHVKADVECALVNEGEEYPLNRKDKKILNEKIETLISEYLA